jgi:sugar phosphate isomerase/epimerase
VTEIPLGPVLTWFPVRLINPITSGVLSLESWLAQAPHFGFQYVEFHHCFVSDEETISTACRALNRLGLQVSMLTCAPDFTNPDPLARREQMTEMRRKVDTARRLGAPAVRVTTGMRHPGISTEEGAEWSCTCLADLADYAEPRDITLCLENHFRDRMWPADATDFAAEVDVFLQVYDRLRSTPVMVNFDTAHPMVMDVDEIALLDRVKDRVYNVHAGDRVRRRRVHCVIGEGDVNFDAVFSILSATGYRRFITVEDGSPEGDEGLRAAIRFLHSKIARYWSDAVAHGATQPG